MFNQSKNWCFTDFDLLDWGQIFKTTEEIGYVCYGEEICPKTKKKHYQGWLQVSKKLRLTGVKKLCRSKKLHIESCRGTEGENNKYCQKDNKYTILGDFITQGKRTDIDSLKKIIDKGGTLEEIANENFQSFIQYHRGFQKYKEIIDKRLRSGFRKVKTIHIYGKTGSGKTRQAMIYNDVYKIQGDSLQWWDGYSGEKTLVIDEYDNQIPCTKLLSLLDGYQLRLEIKGSFTYANWDTVIITSNLKILHPNAKKQHRAALKRRITERIKVCRSV